MTSSEQIDVLVGCARHLDAKVRFHVFELPCMGMYRSETQEIFINCGDARDALLTLAHEIGHHAGYLFAPKKHSYQRERQAFTLGWVALTCIGSDVTREEWIAAERERRAAPDVDTSHVGRR